MSDIDYSTATYTGTVTIDAETLCQLALAAQLLGCSGPYDRDKYLDLWKRGHDTIVAALVDGTVTLA